MEESNTLAPRWAPSLRYRAGELLRRARGFLQNALFRAAMEMSDDGNMIRHAKRELQFAGYDLAQPEEGPDKWMPQNLLDLLRVMSMQGHSGFSAGYLVSAFEKLARFQPLGPLTGEPGEWMEVGPGVFQNLRCSHVFKQADHFNGQPYDIDGRIFREPSGSCFTNADSQVPITFPYTPKREYVGVPASRD